PVAGGGDPLRLVRVQQAELGVHASGGGLDAAEPARDRYGDRLAGNGKVLDSLAGFHAPELLFLRPGHGPSLLRPGAAGGALAGGRGAYGAGPRRPLPRAPSRRIGSAGTRRRRGGG